MPYHLSKYPIIETYTLSSQNIPNVDICPWWAAASVRAKTGKVQDNTSHRRCIQVGDEELLELLEGTQSPTFACCFLCDIAPYYVIS